jgi:hypothetical protein
VLQAPLDVLDQRRDLGHPHRDHRETRVDLRFEPAKPHLDAVESRAVVHLGLTKRVE